MRRLLLVLLAVALGTVSGACRGCDPTSAAATTASDAGAVIFDAAAEGRPSRSGATGVARAVVDAEPFRVRARVPAIGWAAVGRELQLTGAVGRAEVERSSPATDTTAFEAASIAKTIVATCVLQLVEEKRVSLDADISQYIGFTVRHPAHRGPITLRHLLTHTAGIADLDETRAPGTIGLGDFLAAYFKDGGTRGVFFDAGPGTMRAYSNVGPSLAALAVERVTGTRFGERARSHVFEPLGMRSSAFGRANLSSKTAVAAPYTSRGGSFVALPPPSHALYPVVDLFSTPHDLARFARAILRSGELDGVRVLSPASVEEMLRVQFPEAAPDDALGWQRRTFDGRRVVGHEGEDAGASTGLYLDMTSRTGAIVLANGDAFQSDDATRAVALADLVTQLLAIARTSAER